MHKWWERQIPLLQNITVAGDPDDNAPPTRCDVLHYSNPNCVPTSTFTHIHDGNRIYLHTNAYNEFKLILSVLLMRLPRLSSRHDFIIIVAAD